MLAITSEQAWAILDREGYRFQFEGGWTADPPRPRPGRARGDRPDAAVPARPPRGRPGGRRGRRSRSVARTRGSSTRSKSATSWSSTCSARFARARSSATTSRPRSPRGPRPARSSMAAFATSTGSSEPRAMSRSSTAARTRRRSGDTTLGGINIPIRIGGVTVLPGDIVLGTPTGVTFIPPHLVGRDRRGRGGRPPPRHVRQAAARRGPLHAGRDRHATWREDIEADYQAWLADDRPARRRDAAAESTAEDHVNRASRPIGRSGSPTCGPSR